jgi:hypothetical protein
MRKLILSALLASSGIAVAPQPVLAAAEPTAVDPAATDAKTAKELKEMEKLFANIFDTKDLGPIDPQRLTLAKKTTAQIMPDGIYSKMMNGMMDKIMGSVFAQAGGMSDLEISLTTGVEASEAGLDDAKRKAITEILDPNHTQRATAMQNSMTPMMDKMAKVIEPPMREGLARAYARKFSVSQLNELNSFLATPTGSFYASESFLLQADPEVMQSVFSAMPTILGDIMNPEADIEKALNAIPPAKTLSDLSETQKHDLAKLLGTTADKLSAFGSAEDGGEAAEAFAVTTAEVADPFANETGEEPWWDRTNWDKADQKKIAVLESKSSALAEQSEAATTASFTFETEAMLRVRERYLAKGWKPEATSEAESGE